MNTCEPSGLTAMVFGPPQNRIAGSFASQSWAPEVALKARTELSPLSRARPAPVTGTSPAARARNVIGRKLSLKQASWHRRDSLIARQ